MHQILALGLLLVLVSGCSRKAGNTSTISIRAPSNNSKVGAMSAMPAGRKACYGINVTGPGIPSQLGSACSPETGVVAGYINSGGLIEAQVPRGTGRNISLYAFLQQAGEDLPCPAMGAVFPPSHLAQVFLVGSAPGIELSQETQTVTIEANFPGESQNIAVASGMPANCMETTINMKGYRISSASQVAEHSGSNKRIIGRVGRAELAQTITNAGANIKLKIK